jgi:glycyl-tRNA synthetase beta subunit
MSREKLEKIKCGNYKAVERSLIDAMFLFKQFHSPQHVGELPVMQHLISTN